MQQSEWNKLLGSIGDVKKLNSRTLNYYYMALAQTGQLSNALFRMDSLIRSHWFQRVSNRMFRKLV